MIPTVTILLFFIDSAEETGTNDMSFSDRLQVTKWPCKWRYIGGLGERTLEATSSRKKRGVSLCDLKRGSLNVQTELDSYLYFSKEEV